MLRHEVTIASELCHINTVQDSYDAVEVVTWVDNRGVQPLALDTEATGLDPYEPGWELRLFQIGDRATSFNIPAMFRDLIKYCLTRLRPWIMHNAPHDCLAVDRHLKTETGLLPFTTDTRILSHLIDSRSEFDGGVGHRLKENLAVHYVDKNADKGEKELKAAFKEISVDVPGEIFKSGPRKGQQKTRKIKLQEGWRYIGLYDPRYLIYSGLDPILTYRVWEQIYDHPQVTEEIQVNGEWMSKAEYEHRVQLYMDACSRRGMPIDVEYTEKLSDSYEREIEMGLIELKAMGLENPQSPKQVVAALQAAGAELTKKTDRGAFSADKDVLKELVQGGGRAGELAGKIRQVKQMSKRKKAYADSMLILRDKDDRIHASINTLAARTGRMSVSRPPFQQLPSTKA